MSIRRTWGAWSLIALGAVVFAGVVVTYAGIELITHEPLATPGAEVENAISAVDIKFDSAADEDLSRLVLRAVARDPFRPERNRPPDRYRPPGPNRSKPEEQETRPQRPPRIRVLGTAVTRDQRGLALLAREDGPSRVVGVGDEIDGFRLVSVARGEARLEGRDTVLVLRLESPLHRLEGNRD